MSTTAEPGPLLEVDDLVTRYPVSRGVVGTLKRQPRLQVHAVEGVSFSVGPGEMVALVGESGCGKTSTAQTVIRMVDNQGGSIRFDGRDITGMSAGGMRPLRREIQMIYQDPYESLDPRFRVRDTIEEPLLVHKLGGSSKQREQKVLEALKRAGLTPPDLFIDRFPHELSGGQRQRVAIAASDAVQQHLVRCRLGSDDALLGGGVDGDDVLHDRAPNSSLEAALPWVEVLMSPRFGTSARQR